MGGGVLTVVPNIYFVHVGMEYGVGVAYVSQKHNTFDQYPNVKLDHKNKLSTIIFHDEFVLRIIVHSDDRVVIMWFSKCFIYSLLFQFI